MEPTVEFLTSSKDDDNMEFSDSESDEPRRYKSNASEKNIANLKVTVFFPFYFQTIYFVNHQSFNRRKMIVCGASSKHTKMKWK